MENKTETQEQTIARMIAEGKAREEAVRAEIARLNAENEKLKAEAKAKLQPLKIQVSAKGGVSIYGVGRWPVTLYKGQWARILDDAFVVKLRAFLKANDALLSEKAKSDDTADDNGTTEERVA